MTTDPIVAAFDRFKDQVDEAYDQVRAALVNNDYEGAQSILAALGQLHARTSVSMRNYLIKNGKLKGELG